MGESFRSGILFHECREHGRFSFAAAVSLYLEGLLFENAGVTVHEMSERP